MRYYIEQYGSLWSIPLKGLEALLEKGASGEGYDLADPALGAAALKVSCLRRETLREKLGSHLPKRLRDLVEEGTALVLRPLDWDVETFQRALEAVVRGDHDYLRYGV